MVLAVTAFSRHTFYLIFVLCNELFMKVFMPLKPFKVHTSKRKLDTDVKHKQNS